jgi:hypothetical protein
VSSVGREVGLPAKRTADGVTKVSSGRITSVAMGEVVRRPQVPQGTGGNRTDGPAARDGISGPELLAPERTGSTSDRLGLRGRTWLACGRRSKPERFDQPAGQRQEGQIG